MIGVDAGGSKTTAVLTDVTGQRVLGQGHAGAANPGVVGISAAWGQIQLAVELAFVAAERSSATVAACCLSIAGAGRPAQQATFQKLAHEAELAEHVAVTHDAEPVLAAVSPDSVGVVLIVGTGSLAWGRNTAGQTDRVGGWGPIFGDEGSGYFIARAGLQAAARMADGRGPETLLLNRFLDWFEVALPQELIAKVYVESMSRDQLAAASGIVFDAAAAGDAVADRILDQAATESGELLQTLIRKLDLPASSCAIGLTGGILLHQRDFANRVLQAAGVSTVVCDDQSRIHFVDNPAFGAVQLAIRMLSAHTSE